MSLSIDSIARVTHEANRAYCAACGDFTQMPWDEAPQWQKDSAILGVSKIASGEITRPEQSHESWFAQKVADGWVYGPLKDPEAKTHPCMVPYAELPKSQRLKDSLFLSIATALLFH